jgi:hypothetical protein
MKRIIVILMFVAAAAGLSAQDFPGVPGPGQLGPAGPNGMMRANGFHGFGNDTYYRDELKAVKTELGDKPIGELTLNELKPYQDRLIVAEKKDGYVRESAGMSFMMPGSGQFKNGDVAGGLGFMAAHLVVAGGTIVGAYLMLPKNLHFDRLNYINTSFSDIDSRWNSHSLGNYLPSIGMLFVGGAVGMGVRAISAGSAAKEAKNSVDSGKVSFDPEVSPGFLGMRFRY